MPAKNDRNDKLASIGSLTEEKKKELAEERVFADQIKLKEIDAQNELLLHITKVLDEAQAIDALAHERKQERNKETVAVANEEVAMAGLAAAEQVAKRAAEAAKKQSKVDVEKPKTNDKDDERLLAAIVASYLADNEKRAALETLVVYGDKLQHLTHEERIEAINTRNNAMDLLGITDNYFDKSDVESGFAKAAANYQPEMMIDKSDEEKQFAKNTLATLENAREGMLRELEEKQLDNSIEPDVRNALKELNLTNENPSESEIRAAFKKEMLANNPQKIAQNGGSVEDVDAAQEKLSNIRAARDLLLTDLQNKVPFEKVELATTIENTSVSSNTNKIKLSPALDSNATPNKKVVELAQSKDGKIVQNNAGKKADKDDTIYSPSRPGLD